MNGDGYHDLVIALVFHDAGAVLNVGQVRVYYGVSGATFNTTADVTITGSGMEDRLGMYVGN
jgi:hypothetical protein